MRIHLALLILSAALLQCAADNPPPILVEQALRKHLLLYAILPEYPYELRQRGPTGKGIFELRFDYDSGHLREIHIVESTGSPALDRLTIASLKHWKAKPQSLNAILVPIEFKKAGWGP